MRPSEPAETDPVGVAIAATLAVGVLAWIAGMVAASMVVNWGSLVFVENSALLAGLLLAFIAVLMGVATFVALAASRVLARWRGARWSWLLAMGAVFVVGAALGGVSLLSMTPSTYA